MTLSSPQLRQFAEHTLAGATGAVSPDLAQLAIAFDTLSERLATVLQPLFGTMAAEALLARARHVAAAEFPWLADIVPKDSERCSTDAVHAHAAHLTPARMQQGLAAVLAQEIGMLSALIGDDLVMPLVQRAWGTPPVGTSAPRAKDLQ